MSHQAISKQTKQLKNMVEKHAKLKLKLPVGTSHVVHGVFSCFFCLLKDWSLETHQEH